MLQVELKVLEGRQQGKLIPLNVRQFLIGREQDCHLRPNSDLVSRHHCVFTVDDFTVRLRDLGSTNGTFVNGERIQGQVMLKPGDNVLVGKLSFEIVVREVAAVAVGEEKRNGAAASALPAEPVAPPESMETSVNVTDTIEFPISQPGDDTTIIPSGAPLDAAAAAQQQAFLQPNPYAQNPYAMPPGYGMPPGYPPGYPPQGYAPGYPGYGMPAYMPGYGMPQMMPGMQPGYGMPQQAAPAPAPSAAVNAPEVPEVILPDPETTGAKAPEPPPPPPPAVEGQAPAAPQSKKPSDAAADIIRMQRLRRS